MDFTGWSGVNIAAQLELEENVGETLAELIDVGVDVEVAKRLSAYSPSFDSINLRDLLKLEFSRSKARVNPGDLHEAQLDAGVSYAIFISDIPDLEIDSITFELNGVPVHTEASLPWDYDGTDGGGDANRVTFIAGDYIITANVTDNQGSFSFDASFNVE